MLKNVLSPFAKYGWIFTLLVALSLVFHIHIARWADVPIAIVLMLCIVASGMYLHDRLKR
ncbi:hypothetical protein [Alicyclobacillus sendaiensis]|uniref:hypothetical protein n=1 Tax=Alicyclobacillus sendaiensis TaxID=192387 RepID=UPI0026F46C7B|nr:hypothetical protein [Alicyclobacillus sendaiensis]